MMMASFQKAVRQSSAQLKRFPSENLVPSPSVTSGVSSPPNSEALAFDLYSFKTKTASPDFESPDFSLDRHSDPVRSILETPDTWGLKASLASLAIALCDATFISIMAILAAVSYYALAGADLPHPHVYIGFSIAVGLIHAFVGLVWGKYDIITFDSAREKLKTAFGVYSIVFCVMVALLFMTQFTDLYSRAALVFQYSFGLWGLMLLKLFQVRLIQKGMKTGRIRGRRVIIVGVSEDVNSFARAFQPWNTGASLTGTYNLPRSLLVDNFSAGSESFTLSMQELNDLCREKTPDDVILLLPWGAGDLIHSVVRALSVLPAAVHLAPQRSVPWLEDPVIQRIGSATTLRIARLPLTVRDRVLKRLVDFSLASVALVLLTPLFLVLGILIKMDTKGPVFFRQNRHGFNQSTFRIFKFRSMTVAEDGDVVTQATKNDKRVTRMGAFLRRTNLDELPQIWNVILGDMSLVGPRPHALAHNRHFEEEIALYARRHNVKPGITGWAQVNGYRGETDTQEKMQHRVEHDIYYIDNWSLGLDFRILFMTVLSRKAYRNAY
jgi:Undecaprenyl-phosphate glucose phosphotransferase